MGHGIQGSIVLGFILSLFLAGCGGMKVRKEPLAEAAPAGLASAADGRVAAVIERVVVPDGPGSWMQHAEWDEYHVHVRSLSDAPVELIEVVLVDPLMTPAAPLADRAELMDASRETERRYEASGKLERSVGGGWMIAAGVMTGAAGVGVAAATVAGSYLTAATGGAVAGASMLGPGLVVMGAAFVGAGVVRLVNNAEVNAEIRRRNSSLPRTVGPGGERLALFYPVTPLPARLEIAYAQGGVRDRLAVDTRVALVSAHRLRPPTLVARAEPDFPTAAAKAGMESGWVKARLSIDEAGDVMNVEVLESSAPRYFTRAAIATFRWWKYDPGPRTREAVEVMEFRR